MSWQSIIVISLLVTIGAVLECLGHSEAAKFLLGAGAGLIAPARFPWPQKNGSDGEGPKA
jgi:hypothetical protein